MVRISVQARSSNIRMAFVILIFFLESPKLLFSSLFVSSERLDNR